jgi:regulator of nucleoside diphosphate kinase
MNIYFIAFILIIVALHTGISLLVIHAAGLLIRNDFDRGVDAREGKPRPPSRILEDFRGLQETVVAFLTKSDSCRGVLERLIKRKGAPPLRAVVGYSHRADGPSSSSPEKALIALFILRTAGLLRLTKRGVVATDAGQEVYRRITSPAPHDVEGELRRPSPYDAMFVPVETETSGSSHRRRVRAALQTNGATVGSRNRTSAVPGFGQLRKPSRATRNVTESLNLERTITTPMKRNIIMTAADHEELSYALAATGKLSARGRSERSALERELARAEIVEADDIPADVITMNSRAELLDLDSGERMEFTLVFPVAADIEAGKISVLAPLGTAMLGYRVGDEFTWMIPYGERRLKVTAVHFQPEASLALAA